MTLTPLPAHADVTTHPTFQRWRAGIFSLGLCAKTYMKLSGAFSEMSPPTDPSSSSSLTPDPAFLFAALQPWLAVVLAAFGPARIMFGSDWPVCTIGFPSPDPQLPSPAWDLWRLLVDRMCDMASLNIEERIMLWSGTAVRAYGIKELM
jgi:L-rhamnono-1,4-lactonase